VNSPGAGRWTKRDGDVWKHATESEVRQGIRAMVTEYEGREPSEERIDGLLAELKRRGQVRRLLSLTAN
jgi:hypothetical protein